MNPEYLQYVLALVLVLGLILLLAAALRRFGLGGMVRPGGKRRLHIIETVAAGPRHRLILVRRDQTEHLLLLGPTGDIIVEQGIDSATPVAVPAKSPATRFDQALANEQRLDRPVDMPTLRAERSMSEDPSR